MQFVESHQFVVAMLGLVGGGGAGGGRGASQGCCSDPGRGSHPETQQHQPVGNSGCCTSE
jgi:hypothetical protein